MKVDIKNRRSALISLIQNSDQIITLDANIIMVPDRSEVCNVKAINAEDYNNMFLDCLFEMFKNLAIHEAVYKELLDGTVQRTYIDKKVSRKPPLIIIHIDENLSVHEEGVRASIERKIVPYTSYVPALDNKDDRGEVKSLAFIAAKNLLYFAAHDSNAIRLIEKAEQLETSLDDVMVLHMYEIIYYLHRMKPEFSDFLRILYKYQYYLTKREKQTNPQWGEFIEGMKTLYDTH